MTLNFISPWEPSPCSAGLPSRKKLSDPTFTIVCHPREGGDPDYNYLIMKNIENLRKQIDEIDESIIILLAKRMKIIKKVGLLKKKQNITALDSVRWQKVMKSKKGFIKKIWEIIHAEALKIEKLI